jgi:hypothetical protein
MSASKINVATPVTLCADLAAITPSADKQTTYCCVTWPNGQCLLIAVASHSHDELAIGR